MVLTIIVVSSLIVVLTNADCSNYHNAIGIPAAARIKERESRAILGVPDDGIDERIVHGSEVPVGTYPWLAGIVISIEKSEQILTSVCGASLISQNRLVTAGHCWVHNNGPGDLMQASSFEVVLGSQYLFYGGLRIETTTVKTHPKWNEENGFNEYDAAVIYLPYDIEFNEYISPVNLPFNFVEESFAEYCSIGIGYGMLDDAQRAIGIYKNASIHHVGLKVITNAECSYLFNYDVLPSYICTSGLHGVGICQGDSGGPLVTYINDAPILIGITSRTAFRGCEIGLPSIFTRVTQVLGFIFLHVQEEVLKTVVYTSG